MNQSSQFNEEALPLSQEVFIDRLCDQFEAVWKSGQRPNIEDYLIRVPQLARPFLLHELLNIEIEYRRQCGDRVQIDDYQRRFPEFDRNELSVLVDKAASVEAKVDTETLEKPVTPPSEPGGMRVSPTLPLLRRLGEFELLEEISRGGMGIVYKARQASLNRLVAVKVILSGELASEKERQRFQIEAEAAVGLDHPNIVPVYETGECDGRRYFAMKLIEGGSLAQVVGSPAWSASTLKSQHRIAQLLATVARAVHFAHQRGILHRDLKPSNILLDQAGNPHVTDFGLAKRLEETAGLTGTEALLGTPAYMAPEVSTGQKGNYTVAVDVYGLGAVLYELLTGRKPFRGESALEILRKVAEEEPQPPRKVNVAVARDLEIICLKCLSKEPKSRYASAEDLADDLERFVRGEAIQARPSTAWERHWQWCRRNKALASLGTAVLLLLIFVAIGFAVAAFIFLGQRDALQDANRDAQKKLVQSYWDQARANRLSGQVGHRFETLKTLKKVIDLAKVLDFSSTFFDQLRNEAIATMTLPDIRLAKEMVTASSEISATGFDARFERLALLEGSGRVTVHDVHGEIELCRLPTAVAVVLGISLDGKYVSLIDSQGRCRFWRVEKAGATDSFELKDGTVAFSPDSQFAAVCFRQPVVSVYGLANKSETKRFQVAAQPQCAEFHPSEPWLAVAHKSTVTVFDLQAGKTIFHLSQPAEVFDIAWHPHGTHLAVSTKEDQHIHIWNLAEKKIFQSLVNLPFGTSVAFHPAGRLLATTGWDLVTRLWNWQRGEKLLQIANPAEYVQFSEDGRFLGPYQMDNKVGVWEVHSAPEHKALVRELAMGKGEYFYLAVSPDSRLLFVAMPAGREFTKKGGVVIWDLSTGREVGFLVGFGHLGNDITTDGAGGMIFGYGNSVYRLQLRNDPLSPEVVHLGPPQKLPFQNGNLYATPDGKFLGLGLRNRAVILYRDGPDRLFTIAPPGASSLFVSLTGTSDGQWVVSGGTSAITWRKEGDAFVKFRELLGNRASVRVMISPDNKWLATVERSANVSQLWHAGTWEEAYPPGEGGFGGAFSPDSKYFAIGTAKGAVRLIEVETGREVARLEEYLHDRPGYIEYSPDGTKLIVISGVGRKVHVWDLRLIGKQLEEMGLAWDLPPFPEPASPSTPVRRLEVDWGDLAVDEPRKK